MFELPNPLHPFIVHLPIVLTLLGTLFALISIITRRLWLPLYTTIILVLAALGAQFAVVTGDAQDPLIEALSQDQQKLVQEHSEWGENGRTALIVAAVLSLIALGLHRFGAGRRLFAVLTTLAALVACFIVLRAAQLGGHLVYQHGVGVQNVSGAQAAPSGSPAASATPTAQ
ncbi:MAG: hypothetical protein JOZ08_08750 [Verrucomicrobia bacterium]|nr:hypothetical protein [Verrucomicrobiota bacterium]MBV8276828.1 hypothetical protein [Verrucomicrobiota bacterium]